MKRASVKRSVHARLSCLCSGSENTGKMWKDGIDLARLIKDGSAHVLSGRCSTGVGSDSFWCKGSKALPNPLLEPSWWMLSWRGQTHQHSLLFQQFLLESNNFHLGNAENTLWEVQIILKCPLVGVSCEMQVGLSSRLFNEQRKPFFTILRYTLQGIF